MSTKVIIDYWIEKANEDLGAASDNLAHGRFVNAVRDAYFACFHVFSALLLKQGRSFRKHKEVRAVLHRDYIKTQIIETRWGKHYDWLFENRQKADYRPLVTFEQEQVCEILEKSREFVKQIVDLINTGGKNSK